MAQLDEDLYLDDVEASQGFIDVQPGTYTMEIVANDIKPTKACDGYSEIINFRWQVRDEGDFHGQCQFQPGRPVAACRKCDRPTDDVVAAARI